MAEVSLYGLKTVLVFVFVGVGKATHAKSHHPFKEASEFLGEAVLDFVFLALAVLLLSYTGLLAAGHD